MKKDGKTRSAEIQAWLDSIGCDRRWLAQELGTSVTTVNGWLAANSPRKIPTPTSKLIAVLMQQSKLGEPRFTMAECEKIRGAMESTGHVYFSDFARDVVISAAEKYLSSDAPKDGLPKAAEDQTDYGATS